MAEVRPFIVRIWPLDMSAPFQERRKADLDEAIDEAWQMAAGDRDCRMTEVLDDFGMRWARFGPLWRATIGG